MKYLLRIEVDHLHFLGGIRHWEHLKVAHQGDWHWVSGLCESEVKSTEVLSIPFVERYKLEDGRLFPLDHLLPVEKQPDLIWSPIERGLQVEGFDLNHNLFGVGEKVTVRIVQAIRTGEPAMGCLLPLNELAKEIDRSSSIRYEKLKWTVLDKRSALVIGQPLLPVRTEQTYWVRDDSILPLGYDFELPLLSPLIYACLVPEQDSWLWWQVDGSYSVLPKNKFEKLSRSSVRRTQKKLAT